MDDHAVENHSEETIVEDEEDFHEKQLRKKTVSFAETDEITEIVQTVPTKVEAESKRSSDSTESIAEAKTDWTSLWIANVMNFLVATQFSIYFSSLWPYLSQIDKTATENFYSVIVGVYSVGQAVSSPLFGYWSNRIKQTRWPVAAGVFLMIVSNLAYCFVQAAPSNRKWILLATRFVTGFGGGMIGLLRAYAATASTVQDRGRAIALIVGAYALGVAIGPTIQVMAVPMGYPGIVIGAFHLDMYTLPGFVASMSNFIILLLLFTVFKERYPGVMSTEQKSDPFFVLPNFDPIAAGVCMITMFSVYNVITTLDVITTPYTMAMFDWNNSEVVLYNGFAMTASALLAMAIFLLYAVKLSRVINERKSALFGLAVLLLFEILTYPWPFNKDKLNYEFATIGNSTYPHGGPNVTIVPPFLNTTVGAAVQAVGCEARFDWCRYTPRVSQWVFLPAFAICTGLGLPTISAPVNTLFSKILGPRRQGTMQGFMIFVGAMARTVGPVFTTFLFTQYGPTAVWIFVGSGVIVSMLPWILFYRRMVPLDTQPKLKPGGHFNYNRGHMYRF